jgi:Fe-S oxidoreductase
LFEMLQGEVLTRGWRDPHVRDALDLCLACKGCKGECPMNVDMATYKAEFLSHYYARRLRPRAAYAMGLVYWWARFASLTPRLANALARTRGLAGALKWLGGIARARMLPAFADETFVAWFRRRGETRHDGMRVMLWPDTFNTYFHPETARHAVETLEAAGCRVEIPSRSLCCGRPLYDYGMLTLARAMLLRIVDTLRPAIRAGVPVVVLEPSCAAVFRDELVGLLPDDQDARRLAAQTLLLSEFLERRATHWRPPALGGRALVHGHCHQKSLMGMDAEYAVLRRLGLEVETPEDGCCGMAGSFGFEARHHQISSRIGERALLPAVRAASDEAIVIADGFSCREQIAQGTGRHAEHLADAIARALAQQRAAPREARAA